MNDLLELFCVFFKLGAFTIGGGIAMIPLLQHSMTEEKKWFTTEEFVDILAVSQSLPGIVVINMATFVGFRKKGLIGSIVSTLGVVLPSFVMILAIAMFLRNIGDDPYVSGAMAGLRAAAVGLVVVSLIQLSSSVLKGFWTILAAVVSFVLIEFFDLNTAYVILLFLLLGIASALVGRRRAAETDTGTERDDTKGGDRK